MKKIILLLSFFLIAKSSYSMDHARRQALFIQQINREKKWLLIANAAAFSLGAVRNLKNCGFDLDCVCYGIAKTSHSSTWLFIASATCHVITIALRAPNPPTRR